VLVPGLVGLVAVTARGCRCRNGATVLDRGTLEREFPTVTGTFPYARAVPRSRRIGRLWFWLAFALAGILSVTGVAASLASGLQEIANANTSMENTIRPGDRLLVVQPSGLRRGDVVLQRVAALPGTNDLIVRRVVGMPRDRVSCCDAHGRVVVDGKPLDETYLYSGDAPSASRFSVTLAAGQYWLLGDHRLIALDSRIRGPASVTDITGRAAAIIRGASFITLRTPATFVADGLAPPDTRSIVMPIVWRLLAIVALTVLLALSIFGTTRWLLRRLRAPQAVSPAAPWRAS
jgi:signal peptidase I